MVNRTTVGVRAAGAFREAGHPIGATTATQWPWGASSRSRRSPAGARPTHPRGMNSGTSSSSSSGPGGAGSDPREAVIRVRSFGVPGTA